MDTTPDVPEKVDAADVVEEEKKKESADEGLVISEEELSDADRKLKVDLETLLDRLEDPDTSLHRPALEGLRSQIRTATSSMTSVPKPLKFLRPHYDRIKAIYDRTTDAENKSFTADILSLLATTFEHAGKDCLQYRLAGSKDALTSWGHEYVRHLQGQIAEEYKQRQEEQGEAAKLDDLMALAEEIVPYCVTHNAEADACDLLMEIERMDLLEQHVDSKCYDRVCLYLLSCVPFVAEPEDTQLLRTCLNIFRKFSRWPQAMQMALKLNEMDAIKAVFRDCTERPIRRQLAFMLGRQQLFFDVEEELEGLEEEDDELEVLTGLISNSQLSEQFLALARELDILEPKTPNDVYKTHLETSQRSSTAHLASEKANLAATFVSAFVNAGSGKDKLIQDSTEDQGWMFKNRGRGRMSAAASLGMLLLWDVEGGLSQIDKYMISEDENIKAGALLAVGIVNSTVRNEHEPALALLTDYVEDKKPLYRMCSHMGLGLAYAGTVSESATELLLPVLEDVSASVEVLATTALALAQIHVATCDGNVSEAIIQCILQLEEEKLKSPHAKFLPLALGLLYLGKQQQAEVVLATLETLPGSFGKIAGVLVDTCAYAGTGNVLKIQKLLHICSEHYDTDDEQEEKDAEEEGTEGAHQAFATLGVAMVAMGEDIGVDMVLRTMNHLLQYGEPVIRKSVPVAMALLCMSNPQLGVLDLLSKLSHDADAHVAYNSIMAMGLVGAGTNQARIAAMLRHLAQYYHKDQNALLSVRFAQGLLYSGKGSVTLSPFHTDRTLMSPPAVAGLLPVLVGMLDADNTILKDSHHLMFHLCLAMSPRILSTFDEDLNPVSVSVRVGQAVDVVGQAGKPKTITGFVTNNTPVLLGFGERAQLATEEYEALTPILEGFVIVRKKKEEGEATADTA